MKRASWLVLLAVSFTSTFTLAGCLSPEARRQALLNEARSARFVELMARGRTTREEEQRFIRASAKAWSAFRESLGLEEIE